MSSAVLWAGLIFLAGAGAFAWVFRRIVVLFAALDASERIEDNAPPRADQFGTLSSSGHGR